MIRQKLSNFLLNGDFERRLRSFWASTIDFIMTDGFDFSKLKADNAKFTEVNVASCEMKPNLWAQNDALFLLLDRSNPISEEERARIWAKYCEMRELRGKYDRLTRDKRQKLIEEMERMCAPIFDRRNQQQQQQTVDSSLSGSGLPASTVGNQKGVEKMETSVIVGNQLESRMDGWQWWK